MRLTRFHEWAQRTLAEAGSPAIAGIEAGVDEVPFGTRVILPSGAQIHIQWVRTAPPSGDGADTEEKIVTGEPPAPCDVPAVSTSGQIQTVEIERHIAALLNNAKNAELARVDAYADDPKLGSDRQPHGVRILCHSGASIYGLFRHTLRAGEQPPREGAFNQREAL